MAKAKKRRSPLVTNTVLQFKITLTDIKPPIWRRIQVTDCTLDKLHEHIQTAMGWTNSHLHQFEVEGERYGDPELLCESGEPADFENSRMTTLCELLKDRGDGFVFHYSYDFGDNWEHEIVLEDRHVRDKTIKFPLCLEGERACPPEDCGGARGYQHLLEVLANPKDKQYKELHEWTGEYDAEAFSTAEATTLMHEGLPDWRSFDDVEI